VKRLKAEFDFLDLMDFYMFKENEYFIQSAKMIKVFISSCLCKAGYSAIVVINSKHCLKKK